MNDTTDSDVTEFEKTVREFGNGAHVTLPGEYVGEEVKIIPTAAVSDDTTPEIHPPITTEKLKEVLTQATHEDFTFRTREKDSFPREGVYQYKHDMRLTITVNLGYETGGVMPEHEEDVITYVISKATLDELDCHADWFDASEHDQGLETVYGIDPSVSDIIEIAVPGYADVYEYRVEWNGSSIYTTRLSNRTAKNGRFYFPFWEGFDSLEDYQTSIDYGIATTISEAPQKEYDQYLAALQIDKRLDESADSPTRVDSREEKFEQADILHGP